MPGGSSWMPCAPQGIKGLDDDDDGDIQPCTAEVILPPHLMQYTKMCRKSHVMRHA